MLFYAVICELSFRPKTRPETVTHLRPLEVGSLNQAETEKSFQDEINVTLGNTDPSTLDSDTIASTIRTVTVDAAQKVIPAKSKAKFPSKFTPEAISLIHQKRKLWKFIQKSGA